MAYSEKMTVGNKWDNNGYTTSVIVPQEIVGECINSRSCKKFRVSLGNGLCVRCWDRRSNSRINGV